MKTSELTGTALDWAVAKCKPDGMEFRHGWRKEPLLVAKHDFGNVFAPSINWAQGGPLIERELIALSPYLYTDDAWQATLATPDKHYCDYGPTPLIAAMRCYVASKLGDEVEIPKELL